MHFLVLPGCKYLTLFLKGQISFQRLVVHQVPLIYTTVPSFCSPYGLFCIFPAQTSPPEIIYTAASYLQPSGAAHIALNR